jgi:hypothetical protein
MHIGDAVINEYKVAGLHESPPALLIEALKEILCVDVEKHGAERNRGISPSSTLDGQRVVVDIFVAEDVIDDATELLRRLIVVVIAQGEERSRGQYRWCFKHLFFRLKFSAQLGIRITSDGDA